MAVEATSSFVFGERIFGFAITGSHMLYYCDSSIEATFALWNSQMTGKRLGTQPPPEMRMN